jgi:large subunit ribosomal protein L4
LTDAEATESVGESKAKATGRTLERRSVLIGLPVHDPVFYRSARNLEGVQVSPVADFNTYDVLKQRYLLLTREALAALKERVKEKPARRPAQAAAAAATES